MAIFRRKKDPTQKNDQHDYLADEEHNAELLAAEREVNDQPNITRLVNPIDGMANDEEIWVEDDDGP